MPRLLGRTRTAGVLLAAALCVALLPASAVAERTLGLSTGSFDLSLAAGGSADGDLVVMNDGDEPLDVLVYSANQVVDATGTVTYEVPNRDTGSFASNPASWISVSIPSSTQTLGNTPLITLDPGERAPVRFTLNVPKDAAPGDHQVLLFFEMMAPDDTPTGATAKVAGRLGARIRVRVQGELIERMDVRPFGVRSPVLGSTMSWVFLLRNEGNTDKTVQVNLALLDGDENEVWSSVVASDTPVYAGTNLERSGLAEGLPAIGRFTARLTAEYPREGSSAGTTVSDRIVKDRVVWIVPLWLAIAIVVLVALALMYVSWRGAVRRATRKASAARRPNGGTQSGEDRAQTSEGPAV